MKLGGRAAEDKPPPQHRGRREPRDPRRSATGDELSSTSRSDGCGHLALDTLEGVVDGLGVAFEALSDDFVAVAVEVQRGDPARRLGEDVAEAGDEAANSSVAITRSAGSSEIGPGEDFLERRLGVATGRRRLRERHVLVERCVLVAARGLDRDDDLPRDAQLGEVAETRLAVRAVVAGSPCRARPSPPGSGPRVAPEQEVGRGLEPSGCGTGARCGRRRRRCPAWRGRRGSDHQARVEPQADVLPRPPRRARLPGTAG